MKKRITILGSTGSIGTKALEVLEDLADGYAVQALSADRSVELLCEQARRFRPRHVALMQEDAAQEARRLLGPSGIEVHVGMEGLFALAEDPQSDLVLNALVGGVGLQPTLRAIETGKDIALANKETLVMGGALVMRAAQEHQVRILPIDSEHSAIFQCLQGSSAGQVRRLILTASGGPLWTLPRDQLDDITPEGALAHPTWKMGRKITVDCATLMNKGLEVIEAHWLFGTSPDDIQVLIHPQSIVHSMVEFVDGSVLAQLGRPDMRLPIQYALTYPDRVAFNGRRLDLTEQSELTFTEPDLKRFACLALAYRAVRTGGTMPAVLSAANEVAVSAFLNRRLRFSDIAPLDQAVVEAHRAVPSPSLEDVLEADRWARDRAEAVVARMGTEATP